VADLRELTTCSRCILPETFPGVTFDTHGICNECQKAPSPDEMKRIRADLLIQMEEAITRCCKMARGAYDCIVAFSGGKDSTYTLKLLVEQYKLRCLAITIDNGFVAKGAVENCHRVTEALSVDFIMFAPSPTFMNRMYRVSAERPDIHARAAIKRASPICNSCINLINNHMLIAALEKQVPIIAGGYIGGQVPKDSAVIHVDFAAHARARAASLTKYVQHFGDEASRYFDVDLSLVERSAIKKIAVLNPMLTLAISEEEIIESIRELGWCKPTDTGKNSSNCLLNDLGIAVHHQKFGFNPYVAEIAEQVRYGLMTREDGLDKAMAIPDLDEVAPQAERIGMALSVLQ